MDKKRKESVLAKSYNKIAEKKKRRKITMKKRLLSLLLVGAMAASMLVGCGGKSETADAPAADAPATEKSGTEEVAISFYTTETGKDDMFMQLIADFEAKNEGITVEYIAAGDDQLQKWMSLYASNEGPTVSLMDPINIYENQARMVEFTADNAPFLTNIEESALSTLTFDGKVYAAPMSAAGIGILYNKEVLDKAVGGEFDPTSIKTVASIFSNKSSKSAALTYLSPNSLSKKLAN